jgi:hypothetical protein
MHANRVGKRPQFFPFPTAARRLIQPEEVGACIPKQKSTMGDYGATMDNVAQMGTYGVLYENPPST